MQNISEISSAKNDLPIELRHLRVAAYCRVSTELEEQTSSIELQEQHYSRLISGNPNWKNAGIFSERATDLNLKERTEFRRMITQCRRKKIDLILTKSISRFGRNALDMLRSLRELHSLGIEVYFEQENMWLNKQRMQVLLTACCAFAQAESEDMSWNIKWGIKRGFEKGSSGYAEFANDPTQSEQIVVSCSVWVGSFFACNPCVSRVTGFFNFGTTYHCLRAKSSKSESKTCK